MIFQNLIDPLAKYRHEAGEPKLRVRMDVTNKCNLLCKMCFYPGTVGSPKYDMEPRLVEKIVEQVFPLAENAVLSCAFEPFMSRHIDEILAIVGRGSCHHVGMVTNGTLWNERRIRAMIENPAFESVAVSIDGATKPTFERIRVNGNFDKLMKNLELFSRLRKEYGSDKPSIQLNTVLMKSTAPELPLLAEIAATIGAVKIEAIRFLPINGLEEEITDWETVMPMLVEAKRICHRNGIQLFLPIEDERLKIDGVTAEEAGCNTAEVGRFSKYCEAPWNALQIRANGDVHPCNYYQESFGNLYQQDFVEIWNSPRYLELRRSLVRMRLHKPCAACNPHGYDNTERKARINVIKS